MSTPELSKTIAYCEGGPCNGRQRPLTITEARYGTFSCGGVNYTLVDPARVGVVTALTSAAYEARNAKAASVHPDQLGPAWHRLMKVLAHQAPADIRRVQAASARIRKAVR